MIELTPEFIRKHRSRVESVLEAEARVKSHTRRSKSGKVTNVAAHSRHISVTHMGHKFKLDRGAHPERHLMILKRIGARELNLADRIDKHLKGGYYDESSFRSKKQLAADKAKAIADKDKATKKGLAAVDLMRHIYNSEPDLVSRRNLDQKARFVPVGHEELRTSYDQYRNRKK